MSAACAQEQIGAILLNAEQDKLFKNLDFSSKRQRLILHITFYVVIICVVLSLCFLSLKPEMQLVLYYPFIFNNVVMLVASIFFPIYSLYALLPQTTTTILLIIIKNSPAERAIIKKLSSFERHDLDNFKDHLEMEIKHSHSRVTRVIGADTGGLIAIVLALLANASEQGPQILFIGGAVVAVFWWVVANIILSSGCKLERYVRLLRVAAQSKEAKVIGDAAAP